MRRRSVPTPPMLVLGRAFGVDRRSRIVVKVGGKDARILRDGEPGFNVVEHDGDRFRLPILCPEDEHDNTRCNSQTVEFFLEQDGFLVGKAGETAAYKAGFVAPTFLDLHFELWKRRISFECLAAGCVLGEEPSSGEDFKKCLECEYLRVRLE